MNKPQFDSIIIVVACVLDQFLCELLRSCVSFSGLCDTAQSISGEFQLISQQLSHFLLKICLSSQSSKL